MAAEHPMDAERHLALRTTVVRNSTEDLIEGCSMWGLAVVLGTVSAAAYAVDLYVGRYGQDILAVCIGLAVAAAGVWYLVSTFAKISLRIVDDDVVVRNIVRTHRFKASDVVRVKRALGWLSIRSSTGCAAIYVKGRRRRIKVVATSGFTADDEKQLTELLRKASVRSE